MATLTPAERLALHSEALKRFGGGRAGASTQPNAREIERSHAFLSQLHDKQLNIANLTEKRIAVVTPRRWGKTTLLKFLAARALRTFPGLPIPYIAVDRGQAKRLMWKALKELDREQNMGLDFNETDLIATAPNGAYMWLSGAKDVDDIEKFRGLAYPLIMVDESASFKPHIEAMIEEVLEPALGDYDGQMILVGTPGKVPQGLFHDATTGAKPGWFAYRGSPYDNTKFPRWAKLEPALQRAAIDAYLQKQADKLGGWDSPKFRREYLGEWVMDSENLVYKFDELRNVYDELPPNREWFYILGVDFGFSPDPTALVVMAFSPHDPNVYLDACFAKTEMLADDIAREIEAIRRPYGEFTAMVGDPAAKQFFQELRQRKGLAILPAEKFQKADNIEVMNNDFRNGRIKVRRGLSIVQEYKGLIWDADRLHEHPSRPNHMADAALYAYRRSRHYVGKVPDAVPAPGSPEAVVLDLKRYVEKLQNEAEQRREGLLAGDFYE